MHATTTPRAAGILAPVFSLRRDHDLGIGDTAALRELCTWAGQHGVGFIQLLPINETGPDISPYNAISSVALDPLLLEISPQAIPCLDAASIETARAGLAAADNEWIDYPAVRVVKRSLLESAWHAFRANPGHPGQPAFATFRQAEAAWLDDYCLFRVLMDHQGGRETWDMWPDDYRNPENARAWLAAQLAATPDTTAAALGYHAFVQWLAFDQWRQVRRHAESCGVRLMGDIPIGVSYYSADVFFNRELFDLDWCGGAPPETIFKDDPFAQKWGQNWGIPLYRWERMRADGHQWWRQRIGKLTSIFHIFRIDHVLGFYRIYSFPWRPQRNDEFLPLDHSEAAARTGGRLPHFREHADDSPEHCAANLHAGDAILRVIQDAAAPAEVVAEDLGMVPDYVRPHLQSLGIPGFKIVHWEVGSDGAVLPGNAYPECSFATFCTHDHDALKSLWNRLRDEADGMRGDHDDQWKARRDLRLLCDFAGIPAADGPWPAYDDSIQWQLLRALLHSNSRYAAFTLTDLYGREERVNIPGTLDPRNWRGRLPWTVGDLLLDPALQPAADTLQALIAESAR